LERVDQSGLAVEDTRTAAEHTVGKPALETGDLEDGSAVGGEVAAQQPQTAGVLVRLGSRVDDVAVGCGRIEPADLRGERLAGTGDRLAVEQACHERVPDD